VHGRAITAEEVERLVGREFSPRQFASLCNAVAWAISGQRCTSIPSFTERVNAKDGGIDAEWDFEIAEGIDTAAHESAIAHGGRTVAILGTPLDQTYPAGNKALQARLMREHLVVSQFPSGSPSRRENFPIRNRTMALLSDATVIVQAGDGSGSLHQGWEALRLGRPLFVMESATKDNGLSWPGEMLRYGAQVLSRETLEVLFELLPQGTRDEAATVPF
jgi:DNA processing protein